MKKVILISIFSLGIALSALGATNLATGSNTPLTSTLTVGSGTYFQLGSSSGGLTVFDVNSGGTISIVNSSFQTIIGQNVNSATFTLNINSGGSLTTTGLTSGNSVFDLANAASPNVTTGILNLNGGNFDGSNFTAIVFGSGTGSATGIFNLSAGMATLGVTPTLSGASVFNFTNSSTATLTITGQNLSYYQSLYSGGQLEYGGASSGTFASHFQVNGATLSVVPEPSTVALLGLAGLGLLICRSRRSA